MSTVRKFWGNVEVRVHFAFSRFVTAAERKAHQGDDEGARVPRRTLVTRAGRAISALCAYEETGSAVGSIVLNHEGLTVTVPVVQITGNMADDCATVTADVERVVLRTVGHADFVPAMIAAVAD